MATIGTRINGLRKKRGDTLESLGEKVPINYSNLSKIERGTRPPSVELLEQLSAIYQVPISYFFGESSTGLESEWVRFVEEMQEKGITPEELRSLLSVMEKVTSHPNKYTEIR